MASRRSAAKVALDRLTTKKLSKDAPVVKIKREHIVLESALLPSDETKVTKRLRVVEDTVAIKPENWESVLDLICEMRKGGDAPVDTMGCERQGDVALDPKVKRFHTLVALMLSSQTKDEVTHNAMKALRNHTPGGLTVASVCAMSPQQLDSYIAKVGFHNNKTKYIKQVAELLYKNWDSDIPDNLDGLLALPGVGPKMAYLCLQCAWDKNQGIGVDVHVHRIANRLGWVRTKTPEVTRVALESWLPSRHWKSINPLLVGFGQTICTPLRPKCSQCLLSTGLCPSSSVKRQSD